MGHLLDGWPYNTIFSFEDVDLLKSKSLSRNQYYCKKESSGSQFVGSLESVPWRIRVLPSYMDFALGCERFSSIVQFEEG